ncbi:low specificity L-threonine aldolase [Siphonobacter sp. SORGH_AS_1065]|uniref:threonine aldolase family protein n=1 Tax=Siphonobacter sp. SORGH_AS_1065 TaxID=3041795 RepID=UPI002784DCDE|nr:GntG family PLP-dependent aldolase [Siphonobacter sp. SORGH_AS_1065]MDQ1088132.1 threonine aldolase [Siphonobacter sp. SORGH_AS_1065]
MTIDLRSDTLTRPTKEMLEAMFAAPVGDDVFQDDPTVNALEEKAARLFGYEAALFCPSGTMTNQIAIKVHTTPGDEVICDALSHIYLYEGGGMMSNSLVSATLLTGDYGRINAEQVRDSIKADDIHAPISRLVSLENTVNKGGGCFYDLTEIQRIKTVCVENGLSLHLDGARLFNALIETGESPAQYGEVFDSISICLSKGLGCPVGSLLLGTKEFIKNARRVRKRFGGGWRQAGYLAAAGIYALDHHVGRLKEDHQRAKVIEGMVRRVPEVVEVLPVHTNIVIFQLAEGLLATDYVQKLNEKGIRCAVFGKDKVRMVTHLDLHDDHLEELERRLVVS